LLVGALGAILLAADAAILRWWSRSPALSPGNEPLKVSILPDEELVLEGYSPQLSGDLLLGTDARPNLDLDIRMERARISEASFPFFRVITKKPPPRELSQMRYFTRPTTASYEPACRTGFLLHRDSKAKTDSVDVRIWPLRPAESDDFRSLALRSSAALVLDAITILGGEDASNGPGCSRVVGIRGTGFPFAAPLALWFDVPADQTILLTFERLNSKPWQGKETPFRPLDITSADPLTVQTVLVRKPSSKPGEEALAARGEPGSIRVRDLTLAAGRLEATLAGTAEIYGSRVASPGWLERRPDSALGWFALLGVLGGHCALLWLVLRLPKAPLRKVPMEKLFISYNHADREWAEWIAWILEEAGHSAVLDAWDFRPGENFILEMHKAAAGTERTIVVLSDNYLQSVYTQPEWAVAFAEDPRGEKRKLIPFRVAPCQPQGLLKALIYVDLIGLGEEDARSAVLGAFSERPKPSAMPRFPGSKKAATQPVPFPGSVSASVLAPALLEGRPERRGPSLAPDERFALVGKLNALPPQQFNMILFALSPPPGLIPPMPAPQGDRVVALLGWAEGPGGCGLEEVQRLLATVLSS
jgi:hypothetical protein